MGAPLASAKGLHHLPTRRWCQESPDRLSIPLVLSLSKDVD
jgi:hypothetical protein